MSDTLRGVAVTVEREQASRFAVWFTSRPLWFLTTIAVTAAGLLFGVGLVPYTDMTVMADPFNPINSADMVEPGSPLTWFAADMLNITTREGFMLMNLAVLVALLTAAAYLTARWVSDFAGRLFIVAWFSSPVANPNISWLGKPDHITVFATVLIGFGPPTAGLCGGLLLGFNHFEQGVFIVAGSIIVRWLVRRDAGRRWAAHMLIGFGGGRALWMMYARAADYDVDTRVAYLFRHGAGQYLRVWRGDIPTLLFAAFGVLWAPIIYWWRNSERHDRRLLVAALALATIPALFTLDTTRVYSLLAFPILLGAVAWFAQPERRRLVVTVLPWFMLAALFVPRVMMTGELVVCVSSWERFI